MAKLFVQFLSGNVVVKHTDSLKNRAWKKTDQPISSAQRIQRPPCFHLPWGIAARPFSALSWQQSLPTERL